MPDKNKRKKLREAKVHHDKHHVYPRSRKKKGDLGKFKALLGSLRLCAEIGTHQAWHHLFGRLFPEEVISLLKMANRGGLRAAPEIISFIKYSIQPRRAIFSAVKEDLDAWQKIFGKYADFRPLRKIIIRNWAYPGIRAALSGRRVVKVTIFLPKISKNDRLREIISRCRNISSFKDGRLLKIS
ncbi:MAG: hypothetical protein Q8L57_01335 [bacterium]|nr:hypothetical protein [bacterium]